jgi:hypothetical protein
MGGGRSPRVRRLYGPNIHLPYAHPLSFCRIYSIVVPHSNYVLSTRSDVWGKNNLGCSFQSSCFHVPVGAHGPDDPWGASNPPGRMVTVWAGSTNNIHIWCTHIGIQMSRQNHPLVGVHFLHAILQSREDTFCKHTRLLLILSCLRTSGYCMGLPIDPTNTA